MSPLGAAGLICHVFSKCESVNVGWFKWNRVVACWRAHCTLACFMAQFLPRFLPHLSLVIFIYVILYLHNFFVCLCLKQEHTCCSFHSHSFCNGEVKAGQFPYSDTIYWANHLPGSLWGSDSVPLISLSSYQLVAKSRKLRTWERYQMLTPAFVNYSFVCSDDGRDPGT